jgi:hypothetical protein
MTKFFSFTPTLPSTKAQDGREKNHNDLDEKDQNCFG